jgi:D-amino-acid dehydrogenase
MKPQRGQIIHLRDKIFDNMNTPIVISMSDYYLLAWDNGKIVVGATREDNSGFQPRSTVSGVQEVLDQGMIMIPHLGQAEVEEIRVGLRPYSADRLPIIGSVPNMEGLWLATGHGPLGLTAGPYTGRLIVEMLENNTDADEMFSPRRFL